MRRLSVDGTNATSYIHSMATVLTPREQSETAALAREFGGYAEMVRLEAELRRLEKANKRAKIVIDSATGRRKVVAVDA